MTEISSVSGSLPEYVGIIIQLGLERSTLGGKSNLPQSVFKTRIVSLPSLWPCTVFGVSLSCVALLLGSEPSNEIHSTQQESWWWSSTFQCNACHQLGAIINQFCLVITVWIAWQSGADLKLGMFLVQTKSIEGLDNGFWMLHAWHSTRIYCCQDKVQRQSEICPGGHTSIKLSGLSLWHGMAWIIFVVWSLRLQRVSIFTFVGFWYFSEPTAQLMLMCSGIFCILYEVTHSFVRLGGS